MIERPKHPAFVEILDHVDKLAHGEPRFAVRYLTTLLKGRAEKMWMASGKRPSLLDVLKLAWWLEKMREHYGSLSEGQNHDAGSPDHRSIDGEHAR